MSIESRMPHDEYAAIDAINITRLKELNRSPLHYQHVVKEGREPTPALSLGIAAHCATLEPERFERQFAIWDRRTDSGRMAPRNGRWWDAFLNANQGKEIITEDESIAAMQLALAVRNDPVARPYLLAGDPEVVMQWQIGPRKCKARVDWLTGIEGERTIVGLKTTRDCRAFQFGRQAANLGYALQWAFYADGYQELKGKQPRMIEIVVESAAPYACAVYEIPDDVLVYGREEYQRLLSVLDECERNDRWPGPAEAVQILTLPSWVYGSQDNLEDLGLEYGTAETATEAG